MAVWRQTVSSRERFLLVILSGIFLFQCLVFAWGFHACTKSPQLCPDIGQRYETTFQSMTAAVIGLLAGSAMNRNE